MISDDLTAEAAHGQWPRYTPGTLEAGFRSTHALPMRLRDDVTGVLTLLHTDRHSLDASDARLGQASASSSSPLLPAVVVGQGIGFNKV